MTKTIKIKITLIEELLGTASANPDVHREFIASKAPDAPTTEQEVAALGVDEVVDRAMTIFPRCGLLSPHPHLWDYQIKGFFKDACSVLARIKTADFEGAKGSRSSKLTAYKKVIDGLVFVSPRILPLVLPTGTAVGNCQRPLRAQTAQGERIALANSETVPTGTCVEATITLLDPGLEPVLREWLDYGALRGLGQWRNSGKGRFKWEEVE